MKNVLVIGGAGFIGTHVAKWLVKASYRVIGAFASSDDFC